LQILKRFAVLVGAACWLSAAWALDSFKIADIRAEGLQRLEIGTVLSYLPLSVGDEVNEQTSAQAIRALYNSNLFQDVQLLRDGNTLVVLVQERPAISSFTIEGNEKIGGDDLKKSLKDLGLAEGELFKRALLDGVEQELRRQYYANGFYDVEITTTVTEEPNNRVTLKIVVAEGKVSRIKDINILGNKAFSKEDLLDELKLERTNWMPFQRSDRYSKQTLVGDLESLTSYYQNRGYLKFGVSSVQVALSPDKADIYVTINVEEGPQYKVSGYRFSGETILTEDFLKQLVSTPEGSQFSRKEATESANRIEAALSDIGFAFAEVTPLPEVDEDTRQVKLNYYVQPGKRAYVRRINFSGHGGTHDETLRREMRQLEASPFSKSAVERSRTRLARLPFIEEAEVDTQPVPGTDDQVDVNFKIKERAPGSVQFGVGYSGAQGFLITGSVTHTNFLGTGNRVEVSVDNNSIARQVNLSWTDPYFTADGIAQTVSAYYRKSSSVIRFSSGFNSNVVGAGVTYLIPLSEYSSFRAGLGVSDTALETFPGTSSDQVLEFVVANGSHFAEYELRTGIVRDTRNRTFFADRGSLNQLNFDITGPGSDLTYYSLSYRAQHYVPLFAGFFLEANGNMGYTDSYGDGGVPPYQNFFAGGPRTVRGFRDGSLGPRDTPFNNPFGGHFRTTGQANLVLPLPFEANNKSTRAALFFDIGNVFATPGDFEVGDLRQAAGISFAWFTPFLGLLEVSYAFPLNHQEGDDTERFQITFGPGF
jgi:outer membrane protein insertion porin family